MNYGLPKLELEEMVGYQGFRLQICIVTCVDNNNALVYKYIDEV